MDEPRRLEINVEEPLSVSDSRTRLAMATFYSRQHIQSAALFSRISADIERNNSSNPSEEIKTTHNAYVIGAIFSSVSFLESTINEFFWETQQEHNRFTSYNRTLIDKLAKMWKEGIKKSKTLGKYQFALALLNKPLFDKGSAPYQNVFLIIRLRNALIHFEPEWVKDEPQKIESDLQGKFNLNPFYDEHSLYFPHRCLSHGCAKWTVDSSIEFTDGFFDKIEVEPKYHLIRSQLDSE